jgi:hypothetical protein
LVEVTMFGRPIPIPIELWQVARGYPTSRVLAAQLRRVSCWRRMKICIASVVGSREASQTP